MAILKAGAEPLGELAALKFFLAVVPMMATGGLPAGTFKRGVTHSKKAKKEKPWGNLVPPNPLDEGFVEKQNLHNKLLHQQVA